MGANLKHLVSVVGLTAFVMLASASGESEPKGDDDGDVVEAPICDDNDPTYKVVGGRHICQRECLPDEVGPTGNTCETKEDTGTGELFCDCGI